MKHKWIAIEMKLIANERQGKHRQNASEKEVRWRWNAGEMQIKDKWNAYETYYCYRRYSCGYSCESPTITVGIGAYSWGIGLKSQL